MNTIDPREQGALQAAAAAEQLRRQFTQAMRGFASAVTVITVAHGGQRSGYTATSVSSFCAEPPTVLVSTKETSSSAALITGSGRFAVNLLGPGHKAVAQRFTGFGGETGEQRYAGVDWLQLSPGGAPVLRDSVVALDCSVDEVMARHGHLLLFGRVHAIHAPQPEQPPLLYWQGAYQSMGSLL